MNCNSENDLEPAIPDTEEIEKDWCYAWLTKAKAVTGLGRAALLKPFKWGENREITISFLDGSEEIKNRVKETAMAWVGNGMANLTFNFLNSNDSGDVRISFRFSGFSSLIGTDCKRVTDLSKPTMKLGFVGDPTDDVLRRKVLHEFGHVLGLDHEHKNPEGGINWNRPKVIKDLSGPPNFFTEPDVEKNMFIPLSKDITNFSAFDTKSIMIYPVPEEWILSGSPVALNTELSKTDRQFIREQYP